MTMRQEQDSCRDGYPLHRYPFHGYLIKVTDPL
jgi:hypothetical protein